MISADKYKALKILQQGGAKPAEAASYLKTTSNVAGRAFKSDSYEEFVNSFYVSCQTARQQKITKKEQDKPQEVKLQEVKPQEVQHIVKVEATHYMMEELRQQTEFLKLISNKLAYIIEELT